MLNDEMKSLYKHINKNCCGHSLYENLINVRKLSKEDHDKLVALDRLYAEYNFHYRKDYDRTALKNLDEEREKFLSARKAGVKYFPKFEGYPCNISEGILKMGEELIAAFYDLDCFLSKYYIECIKIRQIRMKYFMGLVPPTQYMQVQKQTPSLENYYKALQIIKEHPFEEIDESDRDIDAKTAQKLIQAHIDKLGYKWKVKISDRVIPRMSVSPDQYMKIRTDATFSKDDIEGLKVHEIEGHIGRRYYGLKTGLYLFLFGMNWCNDLDEGLAVWNSINKVKNVKPNVYPNIALKTVIAYQLDKMDFCELFDFCHELVPKMPLDKLFEALARFKREVTDCSIKGGNGDDRSYFNGYLMVDEMTDEERDDILKWNVGPGQLNDLPEIKKFFELNKFEPLI